MNTLVLKGMLTLHGHLLLPPQCDFNPSRWGWNANQSFNRMEVWTQVTSFFFFSKLKIFPKLPRSKKEKILMFLWLGSSSQWEFITYKQHHDPARVATNTQLILSLFKLFIWEVQNVYGEFPKTHMNNARKNY